MNRKGKTLLWITVLIAVLFVMAFSFACETGLIEHNCSGDDCLFCLALSVASKLFRFFFAIVLFAFSARNKTVKCRCDDFFKTVRQSVTLFSLRVELLS